MIVIDPGHGGPEPNDFRLSPVLDSNGHRLREAEVNLQVAIITAELLMGAGVPVILTRTSDVAVSLEERVAIARMAKADLLLSIHHNSFDPPNDWSDFPIIYVANPGMFHWAHIFLETFEATRDLAGGVLDAGCLYNGQGLYLMREFSNTILTEYAFFSRRETAQKMQARDWCFAEALALTKALFSYSDVSPKTQS